MLNKDGIPKELNILEVLSVITDEPFPSPLMESSATIRFIGVVLCRGSITDTKQLLIFCEDEDLPFILTYH